MEIGIRRLGRIMPIPGSGLGVVKCIFRNCPLCHLELDINIMWTLDITLLKGIIPPTPHTVSEPFLCSNPI